MKSILLIFVLCLNLSAAAAPAKNEGPLTLAQLTQGIKHFKNMDQAYTVLNLFGPRIGLEKWIAYFDKNHTDLKKISFEGLHTDGNKLYLPNFNEPIIVGNDKKTFSYKGVDFVFEGGQTPEQNFKRFKAAWGGNKEFATNVKSSAPWSMAQAVAADVSQKSMDEAFGYMPIFGGASSGSALYDVIHWLAVDVFAGAIGDVDQATQLHSMHIECDPPSFYHLVKQEMIGSDRTIDGKEFKRKEVPTSPREPTNIAFCKELKCKGNDLDKIFKNLADLCKEQPAGESVRLKELADFIHSGPKTTTEQKLQKAKGEPVSGTQ